MKNYQLPGFISNIIYQLLCCLAMFNEYTIYMYNVQIET